MKTMQIVRCKHTGNPKPYWFEIPDHLETPLCDGDIVTVNTSRGEQPANIFGFAQTVEYCNKRDKSDVLKAETGRWHVKTIVKKGYDEKREELPY